MLPPIKLSSRPTQEFWEIPVLHEDAEVIAIDKPAGLLTVPDGEQPDRPDLLQLLHGAIKRKVPWAAARNLGYLINAHRLDAETSGVLLLAKTKTALIALANQFGSATPCHTHLALVHGRPPTDQFEVEGGLVPHPQRLGMWRVAAKEGKRARTEFTVIERFRGGALLRCQSGTNRDHQLRAQLWHLRMPIVGDSLYGGRSLLLSRLKRSYEFKPDEPERPLMGRVALHGEALTVRHPVSGEPLVLTAPWPKDFKVAIKYLRRYAPATSNLGPDPEAEAEAEESGPDPDPDSEARLD